MSCFCVGLLRAPFDPGNPKVSPVLTGPSDVTIEPMDRALIVAKALQRWQ